jgi:hypothetical protein
LSATPKRSARLKEIGNFVGWLISIVSGLFTLFEILGQRSVSLFAFATDRSLSGLFLFLDQWYVKYVVAAIFFGLVIFFVLPREEEKVKRRGKARPTGNK